MSSGSRLFQFLVAKAALMKGAPSLFVRMRSSFVMRRHRVLECEDSVLGELVHRVTIADSSPALKDIDFLL